MCGDPARAHASNVEIVKRKKERKKETSLSPRHEARERAYFLYSLPFSIFAVWFASLNTIRCHRDILVTFIGSLLVPIATRSMEERWKRSWNISPLRDVDRNAPSISIHSSSSRFLLEI